MTIGGYKARFTFLSLNYYQGKCHRFAAVNFFFFHFFLRFLGCSFEVNELLTPGSWIDTTTTLGAKGTLDLIALG